MTFTIVKQILRLGGNFFHRGVIHYTNIPTGRYLYIDYIPPNLIGRNIIVLLFMETGANFVY